MAIVLLFYIDFNLKFILSVHKVHYNRWGKNSTKSPIVWYVFRAYHIISCIASYFCCSATNTHCSNSHGVSSETHPSNWLWLWSSLLCLGLHWIHQTHIWIATEHLVIVLFSIDKLKFVELHILCSLLDSCVLLSNFFLLLSNQF